MNGDISSDSSFDLESDFEPSENDLSDSDDSSEESFSRDKTPKSKYYSLLFNSNFYNKLLRNAQKNYI